MRQLLVHFILLAAAFSVARAGETAVVSLQDFCKTEVKGIGIDVKQRTEFHVRARGGGGDYGWTYESDRLFAYGWIINADTRELVWRMEAGNSPRSGDDRTFDGSITLEPHDVPGGGRIAMCMDPQGAAFALLGSSANAAGPAVP